MWFGTVTWTNSANDGVTHFVSPVYSLAVLTTQLNERRAPLFRPNTGQSAGARQGKNVPPPYQQSSYCWDTLTELQENDAIVFSEEKLGCFYFSFSWFCAYWKRKALYVYICLLSRNKDLLVFPPIVVYFQSLILNRWFDHNRWFIRALSCEWGCAIPSTNDRGSQAPSVCPSGPKNWPVWWVPADYFNFFLIITTWGKLSSSATSFPSNFVPSWAADLFVSSAPLPSWLLLLLPPCVLHPTSSWHLSLNVPFLWFFYIESFQKAPESLFMLLTN